VEAWRDHHRKPLEGAGGVVSQGSDPKKARIAAFWSAKFNSAQQNYLQGTRFTIWTDHKPLQFFKTQINLPGEENSLADSLSRIYSNESDGVRRANSEYVGNEMIGLSVEAVTTPLYVGVEAMSFNDLRLQEQRLEALMITRSKTGKLPPAKDRGDSERVAVLPMTEKAREEALRPK